LRGDLGVVKGILRTEFNGGKRQISNLTYKCMEHENMKSIDIK
jgi:hypothetical protein